MRILPSASPALLSAITAICLYAVTLCGTYAYDDLVIVRDDPRVHHPGQWAQLWTRDYFNGGLDNLYRPIVSSSYALQWFIHGDRPWLFHAVNIALHALVCGLVAEFTRRCLGKSSFACSAALCAGLLFAVHPIHVEAVANIVGRAELACAAAMFAALVVLARRPLTYRRTVAAMAFAVIALLCKEHGLLQPLLWLFFGYLVWRYIPCSHQASSGPVPVHTQGRAIDYAGPISIEPAAKERHAVMLLILIISWSWASYIVGRERFLRFEWDRGFLDAVMQPMIHSVGVDRVLMPAVVLGHYTALLLWPIHLSPDYGADIIGSVAHGGDPYLWIGFAALALWLGATAWACITARRFVLFCLLSLAATYGLIANLLTLIGTILAERVAYIPSAFFVILAAVFIARIGRYPRALIMSVLITLGSIRTVTGAWEWNHPLILYQHALATHPGSLQLHLLVAQEDHNQGNEPAAQEVMRDATARFPGYWQAWMERANHALDAGQLDIAEQCLSRARRLEANPRLLGVQDRLRQLKAARKGGSDGSHSPSTKAQ